jgi:hypothetical protein
MASGNAVTINQRYTLSVIVLASVACAQAGAFVTVKYLTHGLDLQQQLMTSVTSHQMWGDMKHDGIQGDVFRLIDAQQRGDAQKSRATIAATGQDVDELVKTYDFVFGQTYP